MWVLKVIYCIVCGKNLGIRMTQSELQDYNYCNICYTVKLDNGFNLEEQYNRLEIHLPIPDNNKCD